MMTYAHLRRFLVRLGRGWDLLSIVRGGRDNDKNYDNLEIVRTRQTRRNGGKCLWAILSPPIKIDHVTPNACGRGEGTSYLFGCEDKEEDDDEGGRREKDGGGDRRSTINNDDLDKGLCPTEYLHAYKTAVRAKAGCGESVGGR
jgi:hypothetical protein